MEQPDPSLLLTSSLGQRFSQLTPQQQVVALREALAWQRQGMDFAAALSLAIVQVELAPLVEQLRRHVHQTYRTWQAAQRARQPPGYQEVVTP